MPIATNDLDLLRRSVSEGVSPTYNKTQVNIALNAGKDWITANRVSASTAIEVAVPGVFNASLKKKIYAHLFNLQSNEDRI